MKYLNSDGTLLGIPNNVYKVFPKIYSQIFGNALEILFVYEYNYILPNISCRIQKIFPEIVLKCVLNEYGNYILLLRKYFLTAWENIPLILFTSLSTLPTTPLEFINS